MHAVSRPLQVVGSVTVALLVLATLVVGPAAAQAPTPSPAPTSPGARLDPGLDVGGARVHQVVVTARGGAQVAGQAVRRAGGQVGAALALIGGVEATVPAHRLTALSSQPGVLAVTKDRQARFSEVEHDPASTASSFAASSQAWSAWHGGNTGRGVGIAVLDTGVSAVRDLEGRLVQGPDLSGEDTPVDTHGHGTVMAGVAAGSGAASRTGTSGAVRTGVAPEATVVSVKVAGRNGVVDVSTILEAMDWVSTYRHELGIRVLNLSWGTQSSQDPSVDPLNAAVQRLWQQGVVVVVAAGNDGPRAGTVTKPADDPMVLTVGAYDDKADSDPRNDALAAWSSRGPTVAGVAKPDLVAPGRTLVSVRSPGSQVEQENPTSLIGTSYIKGSGTSQAAAVVSGLAALVVAQHPTWTPDQVKRALTSTALPLTSAGALAQGAGRAQLAAALSTDPGPTRWQVPTATGLADPAADEAVLCPAGPAVTDVAGDVPASCGTWNGSRWTGSRWTGSRLPGGEWTGSRWTGSRWTGSRWTGSRWTGSRWTGSRWTSVTEPPAEDGFLSAFWSEEP